MIKNNKHCNKFILGIAIITMSLAQHHKLKIRYYTFILSC